VDTQRARRSTAAPAASVADAAVALAEKATGLAIAAKAATAVPAA
jgi:hypothetical protein